MPIDEENVRAALTVLGIIGAVTLIWSLLFPAGVHAQAVVSDPPVELSVTIPGGAGLFQDQAPFLDSLMQTLGSGIPDAQTYGTYFAGWVDFGPDAAVVAEGISAAVLQTDLNTLTVYQSLGQDFDAEDAALGSIEACNQAAGQAQSVLYAVQCLNEAIMNLSQHIQLLEVAQLVRGINEVVHRGYDFNADAQSGANMQAWLTQASQD
jgi:hypothetical protein